MLNRKELKELKRVLDNRLKKGIKENELFGDFEYLFSYNPKYDNTVFESLNVFNGRLTKQEKVNNHVHLDNIESDMLINLFIKHDIIENTKEVIFYINAIIGGNKRRFILNI